MNEDCSYKTYDEPQAFDLLHGERKFVPLLDKRFVFFNSQIQTIAVNASYAFIAVPAVHMKLHFACFRHDINFKNHPQHFSAVFTKM